MFEESKNMRLGIIIKLEDLYMHKEKRKKERCTNTKGKIRMQREKLKILKMNLSHI